MDHYNNTKNGKAILGVFTGETFEGYERVIKVALDGTKDEVSALGPSDRMEVLRIRTRAKRAEVEKLNGRQYCEFATSRGWYVRPLSDRTEDTLRRITINGDTATADLHSDGEPTRVKLRFVRQDGAWRFDEPDAFKQWDREWIELAREEGITVNDLILEELATELGKEVPDSAWRPMKK